MVSFPSFHDPDGVRSLGGYLLGAALILALATALRFSGLGDYSLWYDEAVYANNSTGDFATFLAQTRSANSSPIVLPYLYHILGDSVRDAYRIRILPAVFGVAAVAALLTLPVAGVPAAATLPASLWLAVAPMQIHFSQEVREYSLATFVAALLLLAVAAYANRQSYQTLAACTAVLFMAPLCSYGPVLLGAALLAALLIVRVARLGVPGAGDVFVPAAALAAGVAVSYALTARSQMGQLGVSRQGYLAALYPPQEAVATGIWIVKSLGLYLSFATGSRILAVAGGLVIAAALALLLLPAGRRRSVDDGQIVCVLTALFLTMISTAAPFLRIYPFGGARQHLFAAPAILTAACIGVLWLAQAFRIRANLAAAILACLVVGLVGPHVRSAYGKAEDIRPLVDKHLTAAIDSDVYIYHGATPAVSFHYPTRHFVFGQPVTQLPTDTVHDILDRMRGPSIRILFSHFRPGDIDAIVAKLIASGCRHETTFEATGAKLVHLRRGD